MQEMVSRVTVGLSCFKQNKYKDISDYFGVSPSWALYAGKGKDGESQLTLNEEREKFSFQPHFNTIVTYVKVTNNGGELQLIMRFNKTERIT